MSPKERPGLKGAFSRAIPPDSPYGGDFVSWIAAWHVDDGFIVPMPEGEKPTDILFKLRWAGNLIRKTSVDEILKDLNDCGYKYPWAPRLAGDIKRVFELEARDRMKERLGQVNIPSHLAPYIVILPNPIFVDYMPRVTATVAEVRTWFHFWFDNRINEPNFKTFAMKFRYQSPDDFVDEITWDGEALDTITKAEFKESSLGRHLRPVYFHALYDELREARRKMRDDVAAEQAAEAAKMEDLASPSKRRRLQY